MRRCQFATISPKLGISSPRIEKLRAGDPASVAHRLRGIGGHSEGPATVVPRIIMFPERRLITGHQRWPWIGSEAPWAGAFTS